MAIVNIIISIFLSFFILMLLRRYFLFYRHSEYVKSNIDGKYYLVRKTEYKEQSADTLAIINEKIKRIINNLNENDCPVEVRPNIKLLKSRYKNMILSENIYMEDTSFTINKNETMICLSTRNEQENMYDINKLTFVTLHELTHVGCREYGHGEEFVRFFIYLLHFSINMGLYKYVDYNNSPQEYCGIMINKTPI